MKRQKYHYALKLTFALNSNLSFFFFQKPAFASHSATSTGDLGSFFRECQTAPPLSLFEDNEVSSLDNIMVSLTI